MELARRQKDGSGAQGTGLRWRLRCGRLPRMRKVGPLQNCEEPQDLRDEQRGRQQQRTIRSSSPRGSRSRKKYFYSEQVIKSAACYSQYWNAYMRLSYRVAGDINRTISVCSGRQPRLLYCTLEVRAGQGSAIETAQSPSAALSGQIKGSSGWGQRERNFKTGENWACLNA